MNSHLPKSSPIPLDIRIDALIAWLERLCGELEKRLATKGTTIGIANRNPNYRHPVGPRMSTLPKRLVDTPEASREQRLDVRYTDEQLEGIISAARHYGAVGQPFSGGGKNDRRGFFLRRDQLPEPCRELGWRLIDRIVSDLRASGRLGPPKRRNERNVSLRVIDQSARHGYSFSPDTRWEVRSDNCDMPG